MALDLVFTAASLVVGLCQKYMFLFLASFFTTSPVAGSCVSSHDAAALVHLLATQQQRLDLLSSGARDGSASIAARHQSVSSQHSAS